MIDDEVAMLNSAWPGVAVSTADGVTSLVRAGERSTCPRVGLPPPNSPIDKLRPGVRGYGTAFCLTARVTSVVRPGSVYLRSRWAAPRTYVRGYGTAF